MSLLSRLLGKTETPAAAASDVDRTGGSAPAESPPPDLAARARDEETAVGQAIAAGDLAAIGHWVLAGSSTRIRQMAARGINDPDQLRELIRATRHGKDKNVHRILTSRRDERLAAIRSEEQLQADLDATTAAIVRHGTLPYDSSYEAVLRQLEARWDTLASHATQDAQSEVAAHLRRAHDTVASHCLAIEADAERRRAALLAAREAQERREVEARAAAAEAAEQARVIEAERHAAQAKRAADDAKTRDLTGLLRQAQSALDHGGTARAARLRMTIAGMLQDAPALPAWFARQLEKVDSRLAELRDWRSFRVEPRRTELIQQMQALVGADLSPEELAQRVRHLRDEWRTLNRGAQDDPSPESQQFQEAAEHAYEPCREHFARQAELRRENQARREALIERLAAFATEQSGEQPDWRAMSQAVFEARREWREYAPVDQAVVKALQERFHAVLDGMQTRLDAEYARNVQAKRELIDRAAGLLSLDDTRKAIEDAKNLQRSWKSVGIVPRKQNDALWEEFRRHCDAVFRRSAQESATYAAALDANHARATNSCGELERIAGLTGSALLSAVPELEKLRIEFESLELPRASLRELRRRFARATERCAAALNRQRAAEARRSWSDVSAAAAQVRAYALAAIDGQPAAEREALREAAVAALAGLGQVPKAARGILENQVSAADSGTLSSDRVANEAALRVLCVRAELIAGVETPAEDSALRREYQMQRLVDSMVHGERATPAAFDDLALEWIAVGPVEPALHDALLARFECCRPIQSSRSE